MSLEYTTAKRRKNPIELVIDDRKIIFTPPKLARHMLETITTGDESAVLDWFASGLSPEDESYIADRLRDDNDEFDLDDVAKIVQMLVEKVAGRPTKSRSSFHRPR